MIGEIASRPFVSDGCVKLAKRPEEILNFGGKRGRLLHGSEMTALFHLRPALNVCVGFSAIERGGTIISFGNAA